MGTYGEIHNDNIIKATMEELTEEERKTYLIAEEHLKEQFLQGFKKERGGLVKRVGEFVMPSFKLNQDKVEVLPNDPSELVRGPGLACLILSRRPLGLPRLPRSLALPNPILRRRPSPAAPPPSPTPASGAAPYSCAARPAARRIGAARRRPHCGGGRARFPGAAAVGQYVPFGEWPSGDIPTCGGGNGGSGGGHAAMQGGAVSSTIASSIESLSFINQDLHWKLQQRLATMFLGPPSSTTAHVDGVPVPAAAHV
ncbi:uncharacterized protein LOC120647911 [Panicum virgatum]|uniref:uncharacterized protein LOC120647911 n=1 Tax=Panicum virgatum TaxID=38727 RepID=UPI0019D5EC3B|nr:uncharacterized protein LOC120647911 [Panicum virgatum]